MARNLFLLLVAAGLFAADQVCTSAVVDEDGQLHIKLASGKEIIRRKSKGQTSFKDALIAPDHRTVGWLLMYPYPDDAQAWRGPIAGALAIYRAGRILQTFPALPPIWAWEFKDGGKRVEYQQAPMHGGSQWCTLADVASGRVVATWGNESADPHPDWADLCQ